MNCWNSISILQLFRFLQFQMKRAFCHTGRYCLELNISILSDLCFCTKSLKTNSKFSAAWPSCKCEKQKVGKHYLLFPSLNRKGSLFIVKMHITFSKGDRSKFLLLVQFVFFVFCTCNKRIQMKPVPVGQASSMHSWNKPENGNVLTVIPKWGRTSQNSL